MSLRKRTAVIVVSVLAMLVAVLFLAFRTLLLDSYLDLEARDTLQNVQRVENALNEEIDALNVKNSDWAVWDDTYRYLQDRNSEFIARNMLDRTFSDLRLNLFLLVDESGKVAYAKEFDLAAGHEVPVSNGIADHISPDSPLLRHADNESSTTGIILLPEGPMAISSRPVVTSDGSGPIAGTVIMGRYVNDTVIKSLSERTRIAVEAHQLNDPKMPADMLETRQTLSPQNRSTVRPLDATTVAGYALLTDVYGKPALLMRAQMPREIYKRGQTSINYLAALIVVIGMTFGSLTLALLEKLVLGRVARLSSEVGRIGAEQNLSARVTVSGADELAVLADSTNQMLAALDSLHQAVRSSEERYRAFVERSSDAVMRVEIEKPLQPGLPVEQQLLHLSRLSYIAECNDAMARACGFPNRSETEGTRLGDLPEPVRSTATQMCREFIEQGFRLDNAEAEMTDEKGDSYYFLCTLVGIIENGSLTRIWGTLRDITDRKRLEDQLLRAQRLKTAGQIAGQVAHDFNNLLSPAIAYPELIKMQLPEDHPAVEFCDAMTEAAECMAAINEDMMALGRRGLLHEEPFDLNEQIHWALGQMKGRPAALAVQLELASDLLTAKGSPSQLIRVIGNLITNAREAMDDAGTILIRTENVTLDAPLVGYQTIPRGEYIRLEVRDQGHGIHEAIRDKVFDPFFTTNPGRRQGAGLGLSVVQAIVGDHRGYIDLASEVGKGTSFYIYLPAVKEALKKAPREGGDPEGGTESILIVDDDRFQQEAAFEMLRRLNYRVAVASSGQEAIEYLEENPADLLILDMIMPDMNGLETYRKILEFRPNQRAIVISGFSESELVQEAQALGAGAYVRKPVSLKRLAQAVREELLRSA